jgi:hypothetical protein
LSPLYLRSSQIAGALMDEQRKYAILFAATILCARKLIEMEPDEPNMAKGYIVDKAINDAVFILERIDRRLTRPSFCTSSNERVYINRRKRNG